MRVPSGGHTNALGLRQERQDAGFAQVYQNMHYYVQSVHDGNVNLRKTHY